MPANDRELRTALGGREFGASSWLFDHIQVGSWSGDLTTCCWMALSWPQPTIRESGSALLSVAEW
jgi:hypothetical protein